MSGKETTSHFRRNQGGSPVRNVTEFSAALEHSRVATDKVLSRLPKLSTEEGNEGKLYLYRFSSLQWWRGERRTRAPPSTPYSVHGQNS
ncbi:hypothetical protein H6P81_015281 [Aristolochia fimbriata]|uniref:Uncharacterized protein n=1 Tax=Aristolochia fimbriata TaxID=158543 RepID=A0AAV7E7Z7_ARIFI|nr:hypothetical protein H6P81_015281 [Aristolochia fimbriata]